MPAYEHSVEADLAPAAVWALYGDDERWPSWDATVESIERYGPLIKGITGLATRPGCGPMAFTVLVADPGHSFTDEFTFDGAVLHKSYTLTELEGGRTRITHRVELQGPQADALAPELMPTDGIPDAMAALVRAAAEAASAA